MKPQTEKKILALIDVLRGDDSMKGIVAELQAALACEMNEVKLGKFDLYKCVDTNGPFQQMRGVYHDDGWRVASDGHILIAAKQEYPEDLEGKIVLKDGSILDEHCKYPRWRNVIPDVTFKGWQKFRLDFAELADVLREAKTHEKIWKKRMGKKYLSIISVNSAVWFKTNLFKLFASILQEHEMCDIFYKDSRCPITVKTDTLQLILMPVIHDGDEKEKECFYGTLKGVQEETQVQTNDFDFEL